MKRTLVAVMLAGVLSGCATGPDGHAYWEDLFVTLAEGLAALGGVSSNSSGYQMPQTQLPDVYQMNANLPRTNVLRIRQINNQLYDMNGNIVNVHRINDNMYQINGQNYQIMRVNDNIYYFNPL